MAEKIRKFEVLVLIDSYDDVKLMHEILVSEDTAHFELFHAERLQTAEDVLSLHKVDALVVDFSFDPETAYDHFLKLEAAYPNIPFLVIATRENREHALKALRNGVQDIIFREDLGRGRPLSLYLLYAIERHQAREKIRIDSLTDELTGLYNRRGFNLLAEQQIRLAKRAKKKLLIALFDLDDMKLINDQNGHPAGDEALNLIAELLVDTFRDSDLVSRVGGDEFAVLAVDADLRHANLIENRIKAKLVMLRKEREIPYALGLSMGASEYNPAFEYSLESLVAKADQDLYRYKRQKHSQR